MDVKRRELIKGITATAALSVAAPRVVFANPIQNAVVQLRQSSASLIGHKPIVALVNQDWAESTFAKGIAAAKPAKLQLVTGIIYDELREHLTQKTHHLVGMIDYGNAAVITQLARQYDAKVHWLGQHAFDQTLSRHNILKSGNGGGCSNRFETSLSECTHDHQLFEQGLKHQVIEGKSTVAHPQAWAADLALALAALSDPNAPASCNQSLSQCPSLRGSAVTFFIETC